MPVDPRLKAQVDLILQGLPDSAAFPPDWEQTGEVDYLYRGNAILVHEQDEARVTEQVAQILRDAGGQVPEGPDPFGSVRVVGRVVRLTVPAGSPLSPPEILDRLDPIVGLGTARLEHVAFVCPHTCPATEPMEVPAGTANPFPAPGSNERCCCCRGRGSWPGCDGDSVFISILDTGLIPHAATGHTWLSGVEGAEENPYGADAAGNEVILPYAGHGTFVAGTLRCMAPKAFVYVERAFNIAAADYESNLVPSLEDALEKDPDILVFTYTASSRRDQPLMTFDDFYDRRIRGRKGPLLLAPAGNDRKPRRMWPAAYSWVLSVGALSATWRDRAYFSNYGKWVDVYAPGEDLVNAFPKGTYVCTEPPIGQHRHFHGMAKWSGTSFSTPIVAGMIAARMSATGENAQQAADSLLRLACAQAVPRLGAVLYPGQACCEVNCRHRGIGQPSPCVNKDDRCHPCDLAVR